MQIKLPSLATTIIGATLGILVALNNEVFHLGHPWGLALTTILTLAGVLGISIIQGPAFQTVIALPQAAVAAIGAVLGALQVLFAETSMEGGWRTVLQVVIVVAGTLGFGPTLTKAARVALAAVPMARPGIDR
jgi:hypothetical protein